MSETKRLLAITACPSGVAHTYMAAEHLEQAAKSMGYTMDVETHGSIGVEGIFTDQMIRDADAVIIAADKRVALGRFVGKPIIMASAHDGIHKPTELIERALVADPLPEQVAAGETNRSAGRDKASPYQMLMNGVSHMIPFVVVGGLMIAVAYGIGGVAGPGGLAIPEGSVWETLAGVGGLAFGLMVPILSGFIAYAIADRPGLAPGMITGFVAVTPALYNSESGAGFLGGIVTGFLSGFVALAIKRIKVHRFIAPIWPIIVIPLLTTALVGGVFIYVLGGPIAALFTSLTSFLAGLQGTSAVLLGVILGSMIGFDMGGPVNKTAFLFAGGLIATGSTLPMGIVAVAIAVPPIGMAIATFVAGKLFTPEERQNGIAAAFMGFFGITEGAIPFAAAHPLQIIPANVIGSAVGGALAGVLGVQGNVMWGGPIDIVVGGIGNPVGFLVALAVGASVTALLSIALMGLSARKQRDADLAEAQQETEALAAAQAHSRSQDVLAPLGAPTASEAGLAAAPAAALAQPLAGAAPAESVTSVLDYISEETILLDVDATDRDALIRSLVETGVRTGQVGDADDVYAAALAREALTSTGVGNGIAIPHAKTQGTTRPMIAFARSTSGVDWKDSSGDLAKLVFLIAVPAEAAGNTHLKILAELSRALVKGPVREALFKAPTKAEVLDVLAQHVAR